MKKFFYLMAFVCTLGLFTACSSDDDPAVPTVWDTYQGGDYDVTAEQVDTEDGLDVDYMKMKLNVAKGDNNMAKLTITGDVDVTVPAATISQDGDNIKVSGEGTAVVEDEEDGDNSLAKIFKPASLSSRADVSHTKTIACQVSAVINTATKATTLSITATNPETGKQETLSATSATAQTAEKSPILGTWFTEPTTWYDEDGNQVEAGSNDAQYADGSFKLNWETKEGTIINVPMGGFNLPMPAGDAAKLAQRMANQDFANILHAVAFTADGKIIAQYKDSVNEEKWQIAEGYATYKVVNENQIKVYVDTKKALEKVTDETQKATLSTILGMFSDGVPVNVKLSNNNQTAFFYVDKDFATSLASSPILAGLVKNLKDKDLDGLGAMIKSICGQIPSLMENTTKFEAGLELVK